MSIESLTAELTDMNARIAAVIIALQARNIAVLESMVTPSKKRARSV